VVDLASSRVTGLIPTGWYPTMVTLTGDGSTLLVTNAKGLGAGPNPGGPNVDFTTYSQYVGSMVMGTLSAVPVPGRAQLAHFTSQVHTNNRFVAPDVALVRHDRVRQLLSPDAGAHGGGDDAVGRGVHGLEVPGTRPPRSP
jgi:hypothetical protein